ncbi:ATP-binding cassette domain-containing protein [Actinoplanes derwentensis]|uniref:Peptide/nickel transport system ATP-binding protein n=1 Tax=Actinoplanes derwentensis TaxID=113562 RepID=A0A1H1UQX3_9ACTN|nr:ABC transporter ATP-binding protein [Actinoplanes derwentensis]GID88142.1 glutathione ABC transporter ATP-binding protein [Actinoplanes derwentensis]SDS74954.1 peptide/nickel transport system ATP-binding protein [Actinoplanes derwentensis]
MSADPVLDVAGLTIRYTSRTPAVVAVAGVSLRVAPGQCLGLVGESGSGKSTIGLAVQGLLTSERHVTADGDVTIAGTRLGVTDETGWAGVRGHRVTTVFQDPMSSLDPTMTIGRMLRRVTGTPADSLRWLDEVEIRDPKAVLRSYPHQLSGGMRQRVMIALALARGPALLVADEPTTALDVSVQAQILKLLTRQREGLGCGMLFITHDLGVARAMCDDVAVMRAGELVEQGSAGTMFGAPVDAYTKRLIASRLTLDTDRDRPVGLPEPTVVAAMTESPTAPPDVAESWAGNRLTWSAFDREPAGVRGGHSLELVGVTKSFRTGGLFGTGRKTVLTGVDLRIARRESVALVGESGSGKSTILRIVAGLETADSGDVYVDSTQGTGVQVVFQDAGASLTPWRTVGQLLTERLDNATTLSTADKKARVREALERVALDPVLAGARPAELSGGQRQRVAIARATVVPPALLLCDEPTSALDVSVACSVLNLLNLLRHELGLSILFVTHDLAAARIIADRIDVISAGQIVERVPAADLADGMTSDYGRRLLDAVLA